MSVIMKLRQARNVEQIAEELEPLAVSLATLADQAQAGIKSMEAASLQQAREWNSQQMSAANEVAAAAKNVAQHVKALQQATASLKQTAEEVQQAQNGQLWTLAAVAGVSAILAAGLAIGFWLWLAPAPQVQSSLDAKAVAEYLKPAIVEAIKRR
jgi:Flp pilus assembly protein TadB